MKKKQTTLRRRLMLLLTLFLILQLSIVSFLFTHGGILAATRNNAFDTLGSLTANRSFSLSNEMLGRWGNLNDIQDTLSRQIQGALDQRGATPVQLRTESDLAQEIVALCSTDVIDLLRQNGVTDAYIILDAPGNSVSATGKAGFCVRDYDPQSHTAQNTDLLMECGLPSLARTHAMPLDSGWSALFDLPQGGESDFFYRPMSLTREAGTWARLNSDFSYWSWSPHFFSKQTVTCSAPIVLDDGEVVGVVGVGLLEEYVSGVLHYEELDAERQGAYFLGVTTDDGATYHPLTTAGSAYSAYFRDGDALCVQECLYEGHSCFASTLRPDVRVAGAVRPLTVNPNSSIQSDGRQWVLIGMMEENLLLASAMELQRLVTMAMSLSFLFGMTMVFLAARAITRPITRLVGELHQHNPLSPIHLPATRIREIDALSSAIENQNQAAIEAASRNSQVIAMTGLPLGVFDYIEGSDKVFVSRRLFSVLGWGDAPQGEGDTFIPFERFRQWRELARKNYLVDERHRVYRIPVNGAERYVQLFYRQEGNRILGVYLDVTQTMEERRKIEYERDYDVLTNLLNRRAFDQQVEVLFQTPGQLKTAALIMFDLDNLKYTNDTYGHDGGDAYLQAFARGLAAFQAYPAVVGRRSGDEFTVFLYGFDSQEEIRSVINAVGQSLSSLSVCFPGSSPLRVRTSGGIAWYPANSTDYAELLRMADFAMYDIKRTVKGVIREFDPVEYRKHGILIHGQNALNRLIEERMVRYAFQPIVSAVDGSLYGYELLMRPQVAELSNLSDLFKLAQSQSKLYQLEYLTWFEALATCSHYSDTGQLPPAAHLFINSIGSQCLTNRDIARLETRFPHLLQSIVLEITELDELSLKYTAFKRSCTDRWNAQVALDDYGTGFNSESALMQTSPHIVKVDLSIVRGVDTDPDRQTLIHNLVTFAARRGIKVLAEGVETAGELAALVGLGVDFFQGYYVARPSFVPQPIDPGVTEEIQQLHQAAHGQPAP